MAVERLREAKSQTAASPGAESILGEFGAVVGGETIMTGDAVEVRSPYDDALVAVVHRARPQEIARAIDLAAEGFEETRHLPSWKRADILEKIAQGITARREDFARTIALEAGKPIRTARLEVDRAAFTFKVAAEESKRIYGEIVPLDWLPGTENRVAHIHRVPRGPVVGIAPFNFPLNLVAHKVAPALAAGCSLILRPASQTPVSALKLAEVILEAGWPAIGLTVFSTATKDTDPLIEDERIKVLSFTGSPAVGWKLKSRAVTKMVTLELGGNAGNIVHNDADVAQAVKRIAWGGFSYAGQSCISVQRVYVHQDVFEEFADGFIPAVKALVVGDPLGEDTDVGPVIDRGASDRIAEWLEEAKQGGASVLTGGTREGNLWQPTVVAGIAQDMKIVRQEVFGPLLTLAPYQDVEEAIRQVGDSDFGLQAGLFTHDRRVIEMAFDRIEVGGLMVNDVSTFRVDHMPYGGVKQSGFGREGLRYAIEEMTELKLLTFNNNF